MRKAWMLTPLVILAALAGVALSHAAMGGPDAGGYSFIDNASAGGPTYSFINITGTGTPVSMPTSNHDDNVQQNVPIGFTFNLYGSPHTVTDISTNGFLGFGGATPDLCCTDPGAIPTARFNAPAIFGWWDDWDFGECGNIFYQMMGSAPARKFVVEWDACHNDEPTGDIACKATYEMILFETTNHILFQYADTVFSPPGNGICDEDGTNDNDHGAHASVGIQRDSQVGLAYSVDGSRLLTDGLAICFFPAGAGGPCGAAPTSTPTSTPTVTTTQQPAPTERPRVNVGGAVGAVAAAAGQQSAENRAAAAATPVPPTVAAQVKAPNTGTGITNVTGGALGASSNAPAGSPGVAIAPPNTGDGGLVSQAGNGAATALVLVLFGFVLASVAGFGRRKRL